MSMLITVLSAFVLTAVLTRQFCNPTSRLHFLDHPNERSLHTRPTPRTGGVAISVGLFAAAVIGWTYWVNTVALAWLGAASLLVAGISFLDDIKGISVAGRLFGHSVAAGLVVGMGGLLLPTLELPGLVWQGPVWAGALFSVLYLVWMINLYNFMDGMDGFAGGMAVFGFGTFALLGMLAGHSLFFGVNLVVAAAAAGFLLFNFPPARIFMGDTGSSVLGLLAGSLSLWGVIDKVFPFWLAILTFSPFIVDATVTLLRRLLQRRERVWVAHKTHYYQRLVQLGWGHRKTVLAEYTLMLSCAGCAVWAATSSTWIQSAILGFWVLAYLLLAVLVHALQRRRTGAQR